MRRRSSLLIALATAAWGASRADAASYSWNNAAGGLFGVASNWNPVTGPPAAADMAFFQLPSTYTVTFSSSPTNTQLQVNDGTVTFNLDGQTYALSSAAFIGVTPGLSPRLTLSNGTLASAGFDVSISAGINATMIVGPNAHFSSTGLGVVGANGSGTLLLQGGGILNANTFLDIADASASVGTLSISDPGSIANCGTIEVGQFGNGILNISNGGVLNCNSAFTAPMANQTGSTGQATVSGAGSTWNLAGQLSVGNVGAASLAITNGGHVSSTNSSVIQILGSSTGASGTVSISGAGSTWDTGSLYVGFQGRGELDITNGGLLNSGSVLLAATGTTSLGAANVTGPGSTWNCSGSMTIGNFGSASVTVSNGGALNVNGNLLVNAPFSAPAGVLTLNGGTVSCASFTRLGTFNFNDGTMIIRGGAFQNGNAVVPLVIDGNTVSANPTLVLDGVGTLGNVSNLTVGNLRRGTLILNDISDCNIPGTVTISGTSGAGTLIVGNGAGFATLEAAGTLSVGPVNGNSAGSATLQINQGGSVYANGSLFLGPAGIVILNGGSLSLGSPSGGIISAYVSGQFQFKSGFLFFNNDSSLIPFFADLYLGPGHVLSAGQSMAPGGIATLTSTTPLTLDGGKIAGNALVPGGSFTNSSILTINSGGIDLNGIVTNNAGALITLAGNGTIKSLGGIINNGTLVLAGTQGLITAGGLQNNGVVRGSGNINSTVNNTATGQVLIGAGERSEFGLGTFNNSGIVSVIGGEADFDAPVVNNASGSVAGHDNTLRFSSGLTNAGSLLFTSGQSDVFGNITNNAGSKIIISGAGTATFYNTITNNTGGELRVSSNSNGVFFGPVNGTGSITGSGTKYFEGGTSSMGPLATLSGSSVVEPSAAIVADNIRENSLALSGTFTVRPNGTNAATSRLNSLMIDFGTFDLNNNDLVIDYTGASPFNTIRGSIAGGSIRSSLADASHRLGYAENSALGLATFSGQPVDSTSVLVKYTYAGDANLDGQVDVTDLGALATNWQTSAAWSGGDFNYDGFVDVTDLGSLATNWQAGVGAPLAMSFGQAMQSVGLDGFSLPEPAALAGAVLVLLAAGRRSRW